jgi:DHA1 family tetracycline resistance protein-like MFS transporter
MRKSPLAIIFVTVFIDLIGFGIVIPLMPFYAESFGATGAHVGLLLSSYSFMQFLFAPLWGKISDRIGRRPIILLGLLGSAMSYFVFARAHSLAVLYISRLLAGVAGANISTTQAYIADSTTPENRSKGMGLIGAAFGLGFIFGPAIGGTLSRYGYDVPGYFAAGLSFVNFLAACIVLPESLKKGDGFQPSAAAQRFRWKDYAAALAQPRLALLLAIFFTSVLAFANMESTFALFAERHYGYTAIETGYIFAYVGIIVVMIQGGVIGRLVKKFGDSMLILAGSLLMALGLCLLSYSEAGFQLLTVMAVLATGSAVCNPSVQGLISRMADPEKQGGILGVSQSFASLARILGPVMGGFVFDRWGHHASFLMGGACMGIACVLSMRQFIRWRDRLPDPTSRSAWH